MVVPLLSQVRSCGALLQGGRSVESSFESCALECVRDKFTFDPYVFPASARQQAFHLALQIFHWSA